MIFLRVVELQNPALFSVLLIFSPFEGYVIFFDLISSGVISFGSLPHTNIRNCTLEKWKRDKILKEKNSYMGMTLSS